MKKLNWIVLAVLLVMVPPANAAPTAANPHVSVQPGLEVSVRRGQAEGSFEVQAVISDASSGKVLASPKLSVRAGQWAQAAIGDAAQAGSGITFSASVDPTGEWAAFIAHVPQADGDRRTYSGTSLVAP